MEGNALIAYNATCGNDAIDTTTEGQEQEEMNETQQILGAPDLQIERRKLRNNGVLRTTSGNTVKRKGKTETRHSTTTSLTALKMIAKQGADEKSQLEEWKANLLDKLTSEIAAIHKLHNNAIEAQREEMEGQKKQFQFEIYLLGERIQALELEKEGLAQRQIGSRSESAELSPEREISPANSNVQKSADAQNSSQGTTKTLDKPKNAIVPPNTKTKRRNYASVAASQPPKT